MVSKESLKDIIVSNEEYILNKLPEIIPRQGIRLPEKANKAVIFYGIRRSGKSCVLFDIFRKYKGNALYIDFEDERIDRFDPDDFEAMKEAFFDLKPHLAPNRAVFLLDEVQNIQGWEKFVRRITEKDNIKVFVTGSSSKVMPKEIQTALRGRSWGIEITPFSFREILSLKGIDTGDRQIIYSAKKPLVKKYFNEYSKWGAFPEVLLSDSDFEKNKIIKEYLDAMFFKDMVERFNVTNTRLLSILMDTIFSSFSLKFSLSAFYKQFKQKFPFSKDTLFLYHKYLLDSMLVFEIKKFSESFYKRHRNPSKLYTADVGMCKKVGSEDSGRILENLVFLELRKHGKDIFYFEDKTECDFIVKDFKADFTAYQVTFELKETNRSREVEGLTIACNVLSLRNGTILTYDQEGKDRFKGIDIKIMPVWKWLLSEPFKEGGNNA